MMLQHALAGAGTTGGRQSLHQVGASSQGREGGMGVSGRPGLTADPAVAPRVVVPASVDGGTGFPFSTPGASLPAMD